MVLRRSPRVVLPLALTLAVLTKTVECQWSVSVDFVNECDEAVDLEISSDGDSDSAVLENGSDFSHLICSSFCTGWLGASKEYSYSWTATASDSDCDFDKKGSGTLSVSGFDAGGASEQVTITCGDIVCDTPEQTSEEDGYDNNQYVEDISENYEDSSQSSSPSNCGGLSSSYSPSKSDGLAGMSSRLSEMVYTDDVTSFKSDAQALTGASCVDMYFTDKDTETGVAVTDDSIFITFRGSSSQEDWLDTNINANLKDVNVNGESIKFHEGFFDAWDSAKDDVLSIIKKYPGRDIYISGHSLGGALAQIAAFMLEKGNDLPVKAVYTFGAPPVGGESWKSALSNSALADKIINFIHPDDPVPFLRYATESSLLTSVIASIGASLFGGDTSGLKDLRLAGRSVIVTDSSCEESEPIYNDFDWTFEYHAIDRYAENVDYNCVSSDSIYPGCLPSSSSTYSGTCSGDSNSKSSDSIGHYYNNLIFAVPFTYLALVT